MTYGRVWMFPNEWDELDKKMKQLEAENAKLRELLRPLVDFADCKCDLMEDCTACQLLGDGIPCDLTKALRYMRELEVDA